MAILTSQHIILAECPEKKNYIFASVIWLVVNSCEKIEWVGWFEVFVA